MNVTAENGKPQDISFWLVIIHTPLRMWTIYVVQTIHVVGTLDIYVGGYFFSQLFVRYSLYYIFSRIGVNMILLKNLLVFIVKYVILTVRISSWAWFTALHSGYATPGTLPQVRRVPPIIYRFASWHAVNVFPLFQGNQASESVDFVIYEPPMARPTIAFFLYTLLLSSPLYQFPSGIRCPWPAAPYASRGHCWWFRCAPERCGCQSPYEDAHSCQFYHLSSSKQPNTNTSTTYRSLLRMDVGVMLR